jgi:hypothetical protein
MGLDINSVQFLIAARKRGIDFGDVLTIGRQDLNVYPTKMQQVLAQAGLPMELFAPSAPDTGYAEPVFQSLGARSISSLDTSAFEGAEFVQDLNKPIGDDLKQRFDLVYDGGTLEHVFNFPVALQNCMEMIRKGGRFVSHTCANNWCGHGFYQFSPELFYTVFCEDNGFQIERMILHAVGPFAQWYEVANPQMIHSRVELITYCPMQLLVQARRTKIVPLLGKTPQQSDYTPRWENNSPDQPNPFAPSRPKLAKWFPGIARFAHVTKIGLQWWRSHSLANHKYFHKVKKTDWRS